MDIDKVMKANKLTATEFGALCGVSRSMVYKWISGTKPHELRAPRIKKIIAALWVANDKGMLPLKLESNTKPLTSETRMGDIKMILINCLKIGSAGS